MSSSALDELINFKKEIEKDLKVIHFFSTLLIQDEENIINIIKRMGELKVTSKDIKVNLYYY